MMRSRTPLLWLLPLMLIVSACTPPEFETSEGSSGRFADFRGKWLVINYWATWCKPCIEEIPELNRFATNHSDRVVVLGVDFDSKQGDALKQSIEKLGITFPVLAEDPSGTLVFPRPKVLPTTVLFDPSGKLHKTLVGPQTGDSLRENMDL